MEKIKICFVCTGNIDRSPMAEGIAIREAEKRGLDISVSSAGISTADGFPSSDNAVATAAGHGLDISSHRSRQLTLELVEPDTVFAVMGENHRMWLRKVLCVPDDMIYMTGEGVPDPFMQSEEVYRRTFETLEKAVPEVFDRVIEDCAKRPVIRPAAVEDAEFICALEKECLGTDPSLRSMTEEIEFEHAAVLVAEAEGKPAASLSAQITPDAAFISNLCVSPGFRRRGIASHLLYTLRVLAYKKGCEALSLEVRRSNNAAIRLYEACGFIASGRRREFYTDPKEDAVIMTSVMF